MHPLVGIKKYGLRMVKNAIRNRRIAQEFGCRTDFWNIADRHKKNTLFVLGSGASINNYTDYEWEKINSGTTIGLNFWTLHDYVPDIYCFELWDMLPHNLSIRKKDYQDTNIIIKDLDNFSYNDLIDHLTAIPSSLLTNTFLSLDFDYPIDTLDEFEQYLNTLDIFGFFDKKWLPVPRKVGTIFYITALASKIGFSQIVLCGVDLNNPECFFDKDRDSFPDKKLMAPEKINNKTHKTYDNNAFTFTIDQALLLLNNTILSKKNITLFTATESSALYPKLPVYFKQ